MTTHKVPETYDVETSIHSDRYSVHWETPEARFHVWMKGPGQFVDQGVVFKNPPLGINRGGEGDFDTRRLDLTKGVWVDVAEWLLNLPDGDFGAAQHAARVRAEVEDRKRREKRVAEDMETLAGLLGQYFPKVSVADLENLVGH